ncbi:MAG: hypothetical protein HC781_20060 [Leptolyngbyaceae cyanobacterium CSU_1_4]|nr:hypothetical protein [Leptolyngbyaceae cyanobacterium CSU_1_4]
MQNSLFDKTFRDGDGNIVIGQLPNLPISLWLVATLLNLMPVGDPIHRGLEAIAFGLLFTWAWQEIFEGVNYFRRTLGFTVLMGAIAFVFLRAA